MINPPLWRQILRKNFTDPEALADFLQLKNEFRQSIAFKQKFPLNLPYRLALKIQKNCLDDPILKQFLPSKEELKFVPGYSIDPVAEIHCQKSPKLLQKYQGRVLLVCTSACAMHCRYCFRQNYEYDVLDKSFDEEV